MPTTTPFTPSSLIPYGVQAGLGFIGSKLANRPTNQQNQWSRQLMEQQLARQRALQGIALPSMIRALGYTDPQQIQRMTNSVNSPTPSGFGNVPQGTSFDGGGGSTAGTIGKAALGMAPLALTAAHGAGLLGGAAALTPVNPVSIAGGVAAHGLGATLGGLATNPFTLAGAGILGAGLVAKHYIGQGRKTADKATQNGGFEQNFDSSMAEAVRRRDAGDVEGAKQVLQQGYQGFMQGAQGFQGQGGNKAKVANQAMNQNPEKWQTYESIKKSLGMV